MTSVRGPRSRAGLPRTQIATIVGVVAALAILGPDLAPYRPAALSGDPLEAPSSHHLLGTNLAGQDLLSHILVGARASIVVAAGAGAVAARGSLAFCSVNPNFFRIPTDLGLSSRTVASIPRN